MEATIEKNLTGLQNKYGRRTNGADAKQNVEEKQNTPPIKTVNPATNELVESFKEMTEEEIYPADKILYYRGGMHDWITLGLPVQQL
jgi:hypothetical protein